MTSEQIEEMKARYKAGEDIIILARDYKIRNQRVREICGPRKKRRKTATSLELKAEIVRLKELGLSPLEISKAMGITLGKAEYYSYGYDIKAESKRKETKKRIKPEYKPMPQITTYLDGGWRVFEDENRKAGRVSSVRYTKEELAEKFGSVIHEAQRKHKDGKAPVLTNLEMHWKNKRGA